MNAPREQNDAYPRPDIDERLRDRYEIYRSCLPPGQPPKTFDEWLNS